MDPDDFRRSQILHLTGISGDDHSMIEDKFEEMIIEHLGCSEEAVVDSAIYDVIPREFTGLDSWPERVSNVHCWMCDRTIPTRPVPIPIYVKKDDTKTGGLVIGRRDEIMCCFSCATLFINMVYNGEQCWRIHEMLRSVFHIFTGRRVGVITPAPPKTKMRKYGSGGTWSLAEFEAELTRVDPEMTERKKKVVISGGHVVPKVATVHEDEDDVPDVWSICDRSPVELAMDPGSLIEPLFDPPADEHHDISEDFREAQYDLLRADERHEETKELDELLDSLK